jgi:ATP-dependent RNA helicase SUPV3L1/SUV3
LQPLWKAAINKAAAPLEAMQAQSLALRHAMIEEAKVLGAAKDMRVDAVRALQQRWQAQAHAVPIDRRQEQKLWDAFRKPIDDAFNRKSAERESAEAALGARDKGVLQAAKAVEAANASGDAQAIRAALAALEAALHGQAQAQQEVKAAGLTEQAAKAVVQTGEFESNDAVAPVDEAQAAIEMVANEAPAVAAPELPVTPKPVPKPVVAVRGDDRPGMKKDAPAAPARGGKWTDRKEGGRPGRDATTAGGPSARPGSRDGAGRGDRFAPRDEGPRLGDAAFRAQREAFDNAQAALRKLAAQAHGEALTHLLAAWEKRDPALVPSAQELGSKSAASHRGAWIKALEAAPANTSSDALQQSVLRLEMAAEVPTPAEHLAARRNLQLQLLTRRNDPPPAQTWAQDTAAVLQGTFDPAMARRVQTVLKVLMKS